jgi:dihydroflavonol-4-reductase
MKAVVTGAAGHLGGNLVRALLAQGAQVRALVHHDRRALDGLDVEITQAGLDDPAALQRAFAGADIVFHLASLISLRRRDRALVERVNVQGARHVVEACLAAGAGRLVYAGSIEALDPRPHDQPVSERRPLLSAPGVSPYAWSKAEAERVVQAGIARGLDAVIITPTAIVGPYDFKPSHFGQALIGLANGRLPALVGSGFNWVDARDVAEGAILTAANARAGAKYLLGGTWASVGEIAALAAAITGARPPRLTAPLWLARFGAPFCTAWADLTGTRPLYTLVTLDALGHYPRVSCAKAKRDLGYRPRPLFDTLLDTYRWLEEAGFLRRPLALPDPEIMAWLNSPSSTASSTAGSPSRR